MSDPILLGKLMEKLENLSRWQENHDKTSAEWRQSLDSRIQPIENFVRDFGSVKRVIFGTLAALGTLATAGIALYTFFKAHWRG